MRTKEEIITAMVDIMPFHLNECIKPYIYEAMDIYAKEQTKISKLNNPPAFSEVIGQWVDAQDQLPEKNLMCLVLYLVGKDHRYYGIGNYWTQTKEWTVYTIEGTSHEKVLYWMELPKKPISS